MIRSTALKVIRFILFGFLNDENECTKDFIYTKHFANVKFLCLEIKKAGHSLLLKI